MTDEFERLGASFQYQGGNDQGDGYLAGLTKLMFPGDGQVIEHLLATGRLSPKKARANTILLNKYFRDSAKPKGYSKKAIDWWGMSEGARIAMLGTLMSVSHGGQGRGELTSVLGAVTRFVSRSRGGQDKYGEE
jgi:hypothetical protein